MVAWSESKPRFPLVLYGPGSCFLLTPRRPGPGPGTRRSLVDRYSRNASARGQRRRDPRSAPAQPRRVLSAVPRADGRARTWRISRALGFGCKVIRSTSRPPPLSSPAPWCAATNRAAARNPSGSVRAQSRIFSLRVRRLTFGVSFGFGSAHRAGAPVPTPGRPPQGRPRSPRAGRRAAGAHVCTRGASRRAAG